MRRAHIIIRITLPHADPYIFPLVAVLACFGLVMIYRISTTDARQQAQWFVLGLRLFAGTIAVFSDYRKLEHYRYLIMSVSLLLLVLPRIRDLGDQVNGAYLAVHIPGVITFQPTEFAKLGLVVFLASYLRDTRQVMVMGARRFLGVTIPPIKHFGQVLVIWAIAMVILLLLHDIGSSLMFYGALLAMLYIATNKSSFVIVGLVAFGIGAWYLGTHIPHIHDRAEDVAAPLQREPVPQDRRQLPTRERAVREGSRGSSARIRADDADDPQHPSGRIPAARARHGHDLRGDHGRARPVRGLCRAAHLPAVHRPRLQGRDPGARLVLKAARSGPLSGPRYRCS